MTWADITRRGTTTKKPPPNNTPQATRAMKKPTRLPLTTTTLHRFNDIERRTQVLRKLPHDTTTSSIIADLQKFKPDIGSVIEAVIREPLDRRRFYIRYRSVEMKRSHARSGFKIGDITIPPERADITGFISNLPHYMSLDDITSILAQYGDVVSAAFKTFEDTDIRCGGLKFELNLHANKKLPRAFVIMDDTFTIETPDDLQRCSFCDNYGHIHRFCRKKRESMEKAAAEAENQEDLQEEVDEMELDIAANPNVPTSQSNGQQQHPQAFQQTLQQQQQPPQHEQTPETTLQPKSIPQEKRTPPNEQTPQEKQTPPNEQATTSKIQQPNQKQNLNTTSKTPPTNQEQILAVENSTTPGDDTSADKPPAKKPKQPPSMCWEVPPLDYKKHPCDPYVQPTFTKKEITKQEVEKLFVDIVHQRWNVHHSDYADQFLGGLPPLGPRAAKEAHNWTVRKVKTDLWQTKLFRDSWDHLCRTTRIFDRQYDVT